MMRSAILMISMTLLGAGCGGPSIVGTWNQSDATSGKTVSRLMLGADGAFTAISYDGNGKITDTTTGTYQTSGHDVTADATSSATRARQRVVTGFYVTDTQLATTALFPDGQHQGIVGTWQGSLKVDEYDAMGAVQKSTSISTSYVFSGASGGQAAGVTVTVDSGGGTRLTSGGTYTDAGGGVYKLSLATSGGGSSTQQVTMLGGEALGAVIYQRQ